MLKSRSIQSRKSPRPGSSPAQGLSLLASRSPALIGTNVDIDPLLGALKVAVWGAGAVGGRVALHLARSRLNTLLLADDRSFKAESVLTHEIEPRWVGQNKAMATARLCRRISPTTHVEAFPVPVQKLPWDILHDLDAVIMAFDHPEPEIFTGLWCRQWGVPLFHAAVFGQTMTAQVRAFDNESTESPCPGCGFGPVEWRQMSQEVRYSCDALLTGQRAAVVTGPPTRSFPSLCSLSADLAVNQLLREVVPFGSPVRNTVVDYCGYHHLAVVSPLKRHPGCRCDHTRFTVKRAPSPLGAMTLEEVIALAGKMDPATLTLQVQDAEWVARGACRCREVVELRRFVRAGRQPRRRCRRCGQSVQPGLLDVFPTALVRDLGRALQQPLHGLGLAHARWILLRDSHGGTVVHHPTPTTRSHSHSNSR